MDGTNGNNVTFAPGYANLVSVANLATRSPNVLDRNA